MADMPLIARTARVYRAIGSAMSRNFLETSAGRAAISIRFAQRRMTSRGLHPRRLVKRSLAQPMTTTAFGMSMPPVMVCQ
jgi:hypothetical protein